MRIARADVIIATRARGATHTRRGGRGAKANCAARLSRTGWLCGWGGRRGHGEGGSAPGAMLRRHAHTRPQGFLARAGTVTGRRFRRVANSTRPLQARPVAGASRLGGAGQLGERGDAKATGYVRRGRSEGRTRRHVRARLASSAEGLCGACLTVRTAAVGGAGCERGGVRTARSNGMLGSASKSGEGGGCMRSVTRLVIRQTYQ
ncbi:hypothetical protein OBBRIDRAFT_156019 [Obba rivulosa]|uniref:Uncharacterized protein n=1 Tax=Obba rivulosa TaxID=1052685 RepID=A0A8E2DHY0_9APHY|nr:hypothetical protein OBBRIDRAFT_156019 [Obba rivulosa]